jgi:hypothetical protein
MAELPGSLSDARFFLVNGVTPFQERVFHKIRLPEEIKPFRPFHEESNNVTFRFLFKNTVILKGRIAENGKPMGTPPPLVEKPLSVPPEGKALLIRRKEAEAPAVPPGKTPRRNLFTEGNGQGKIMCRLPEPRYCPSMEISQRICKVTLDDTFTAGLICA